MPKGNGKPIPKVEINLKPTTDQVQKLLATLQKRFSQNESRHPRLSWGKIQAELGKQTKNIATLFAMECTGGEPDVVRFDTKQDTYFFLDCSAQTPAGRRSICYDQAGEKERHKKGIYPGGNAVELAQKMGLELLSEEQYRKLQELGEFDTTTSSWLLTPSEIRKKGGALFGDRRYGQVFVYHNGAPSFYSARGFRGLLRI